MKYFLFIFCLATCHLSSQITPKTLACFPARISESSGIIVGENNTYWTHNDGGDSGYIYQLNADLSILKKLKITNSIDEDVEDITQDEDYIYVNDMGNNNNKRKDLRIYKIRKEIINTKTEVYADVIEFSYENQSEFPPEKEFMNFDCEAFISLGDYLYLFSKNRGKSNYSYIYQLPKKEGNYKAKLVDSVLTGMWITSAALSPDKSKFALMSNGLIYVFTDLVDNNFSKAKMNRFTVPYTQKEGICFQDDNTLLITDERNSATDGCLYQIDLNQALTAKNRFTYFNVDPIVEKNKFYFFNYELMPMDIELSFYNSSNEQIQVLKQTTKSSRRSSINFYFPKGTYTAKFKYKDIEEAYSFKVVE